MFGVSSTQMLVELYNILLLTWQLKLLLDDLMMIAGIDFPLSPYGFNQCVVYFNQQMGALHTVHWSK